MATKVELENTQQTMKNGLDLVAKAVRRTMGVRGKNVAIRFNKHLKPLITNDGVTVARHVESDDDIEQMGVDMIREVGEKTNDMAGDGTTTSMLLMHEIVNKGMRAINSGSDGIRLRRGISKATENVVKYLETERVEATDEKSLASVATISSRDAEIGKLIAKVVKEAGADGIFTIEDRQEPDTVYERTEGIRLTGGYLSDKYINLPERQQASFNNVPILVTNKTMTLAEEMGRVMEVVANMGKKEAVVIANGIEGDALITSFVNWQKKSIFVLPVRVIAYGDAGEGMLKDVAAITGATYLDENEKHLNEVTRDDFGVARKVVTDRHYTTVITDDEELKRERIKELEAAIEPSREFERENLRERIAKLRSAMFTIKVGGVTETERNELKTRVDDAIKAAKAALEDGIVAGGGTSLYRAQLAQKKPDTTTDEGVGELLVYEACAMPIKQMAENAGYSLDRTDFEEIEPINMAIDFGVGKVVDAFKGGIIDPLKVVKQCITNASTAAALFLTLDGAIAKDDKNEEQV